MGKKRVPSYSELIKKGIPAVLIPGIIFAAIYGARTVGIKNYYEDERIFPHQGVVAEVEDGDTFKLNSGQTVRLLGVDAPNRGKQGSEESKKILENEIENKKIWLEYDRYQDDKYGRILAWVWRDCETNKPKFLAADYMHLNGRQSKEYVTDKAEGCRRGVLINKVLVEKGAVETVEYEKRGKLKYDLKQD